MNKNEKVGNGGPAFPHKEFTPDGCYDKSHPGLTKLDWFAGMAMQGLLAADHGNEDNWDLESLANYSYAAAIEMLASRNEVEATLAAAKMEIAADAAKKDDLEFTEMCRRNG